MAVIGAPFERQPSPHTGQTWSRLFRKGCLWGRRARSVFRGRAPDLWRRAPLKSRMRSFEAAADAGRHGGVCSVCMGMEGENRRRASCCHSGGNTPEPSGMRLRGERGALQRQAPVSWGVCLGDCVGLDALLMRSFPDQKLVFGLVQVAPVGKTAQIGACRFRPVQEFLGLPRLGALGPVRIACSSEAVPRLSGGAERVALRGCQPAPARASLRGASARREPRGRRWVRRRRAVLRVGLR